MIKEINQDIFLAQTNAIIHQANCFCTMGSGIARVIRENFPPAYAADLKTRKGDVSKLGKFSYAAVHTDANLDLKYIFNLYSQYQFGMDKRHTNYEAMVTGLENIANFVLQNPDFGIKTLAVPYKMGSDRGGGDWRVVRAILESVFEENDDLTLLICKL